MKENQFKAELGFFESFRTGILTLLEKWREEKSFFMKVAKRLF